MLAPGSGGAFLLYQHHHSWQGRDPDGRPRQQLVRSVPSLALLPAHARARACKCFMPHTCRAFLVSALLGQDVGITRAVIGSCNWIGTLAMHALARADLDPPCHLPTACLCLPLLLWLVLTCPILPLPWSMCSAVAASRCVRLLSLFSCSHCHIISEA